MSKNIDIKAVAQRLVVYGLKHHESSSRIDKGDYNYADLRNVHYYLEQIRDTVKSLDEETRVLVLAEVEAIGERADREIEKNMTWDCEAGRTRIGCNVVNSIVSIHKDIEVADLERGKKSNNPTIDLNLEPLEPIAPGATSIPTNYYGKVDGETQSPSNKNVWNTNKRIEEYISAKRYNRGVVPTEEPEELTLNLRENPLDELNVVAHIGAIENLGSDGPETTSEGCLDTEPSGEAQSSAKEPNDSAMGDGSM